MITENTDFSHNIDVKKWTVKLIKNFFKVNDIMYVNIKEFFQAELNRLNLLKTKFNTVNSKERLQPVFTSINKQFPTTFDTIPDTVKKKSLTALAQKCSYNKKR
jgi:hypothetical protein